MVFDSNKELRDTKGYEDGKGKEKDITKPLSVVDHALAGSVFVKDSDEETDVGNQAHEGHVDANRLCRNKGTGEEASGNHLERG